MPVMPETSSALQAGKIGLQGGGDRGLCRGGESSPDQGVGVGGGLLRGLLMWAALHKCLSPVHFPDALQCLQCGGHGAWGMVTGL